MKINDYMLITLIFVFFFILVSIQFTLNQILKVLKELKEKQDRKMREEINRIYDKD